MGSRELQQAVGALSGTTLGGTRSNAGVCHINPWAALSSAWQGPRESPGKAERLLRTYFRGRKLRDVGGGLPLTRGYTSGVAAVASVLAALWLRVLETRGGFLPSAGELLQFPSLAWMFNFITWPLGPEKIPPEPIINILKMESILSEQTAKIIFCQGVIFAS